MSGERNKCRCFSTGQTGSRFEWDVDHLLCHVTAFSICTMKTLNDKVPTHLGKPGNCGLEHVENDIYICLYIYIYIYLFIYLFQKSN